MTVKLANGATIAIENGTGANIAITGITNANPAVVTTGAAHGLITGDFAEIVSGWSKLTNKIVRVTMLTTTTFSIDGVDTTLVSLYPAGSGAGTVAKVTGFTQLSQIISINTSGGEQQFLTYQLLEGDAQKQIPTFKTPFQVTMSVADDPTLAGFILAGVANDDRLPRAIKVTLADSSIILYNGFLSINRTPSLTVNELMACQATIALLNEPVRY